MTGMENINYNLPHMFLSVSKENNNDVVIFFNVPKKMNDEISNYDLIYDIFNKKIIYSSREEFSSPEFVEKMLLKSINQMIDFLKVYFNDEEFKEISKNFMKGISEIEYFPLLNY